MTDLYIHVSRRAMACEFEVRFPAGRYDRGTESALDALDLVEALEEQLSYFRPTNELSRVNLLAAEGPVEVTPPLFDLLRLAMTLYEETEGAYDVTSAPLWEAWGFARRAGEIPSDAQLAEARSRVGGHLVELDAAHRTVRFRKPGVRINLGSIGKGHALDVCAERLLALGMADFLLHGGQSSVLARGCPVGQASLPVQDRPQTALTPCPSPKGRGEMLSCPSPKGRGELLLDGRLPCPWEIGVTDPRQPGRRLGVVRLRNRALGTSGTQFQMFRHGGRRYGHILDPRSGRPAETVLSTTVVAPTAALADALSTAFYVMGPDRAIDYCRTRRGSERS